MSGDSLRKVVSGEEFLPSASAHNAFVDAANFVKAHRADLSRRAGRSVFQPDVVLVRNDAGEDRDRFDILGLGEPLITPEENPDEFENRPAFLGVEPDETHAGRFCVLLEPIASGGIGTALVDGVTVVRLNVEEEGNAFAEVKADEMTELVAGSSGSAQILWKEEGTGSGKWGVVRLGSKSPALLKARITSDFLEEGGSAQADLLDDEGEATDAITVETLFPNGQADFAGVVYKNDIIPVLKHEETWYAQGIGRLYENPTAAADGVAGASSSATLDVAGVGELTLDVGFCLTDFRKDDALVCFWDRGERQWHCGKMSEEALGCGLWRDPDDEHRLKVRPQDLAGPGLVPQEEGCGLRVELFPGCGTVVDGPAVAVDLGQLVELGNGLELSEGECPKLSFSVGCGLIEDDAGNLQLDLATVAGPGLEALGDGPCDALGLKVGCGLHLVDTGLAVTTSQLAGAGLKTVGDGGDCDRLAVDCGYVRSQCVSCEYVAGCVRQAIEDGDTALIGTITNAVLERLIDNPVFCGAVSRCLNDPPGSGGSGGSGGGSGAPLPMTALPMRIGAEAAAPQIDPAPSVTQRIVRDTVASPRTDLACVHRGCELRRVPCGTCPSRKGIHWKVFACDLHGECLLGNPTAGVRSCRTCRDRAAPAAASSITWACGVTTAPRRTPTLERCLASIRAAGWEPTLFAEPGSPLPPSAGDVVLRNRTFGAWDNFVAAAEELLQRGTTHVLLFEDDALICDDARSLLATDWPARVGCRTLYTPSREHRDEGGPHPIATADFVGALALAFPDDVLRRLLGTAAWRRGTDHTKDPAIGRGLAELGLTAEGWSPSPVKHLGVTSTIWDETRTAAGPRAEKVWRGDRIAAGPATVCVVVPVWKRTVVTAHLLQYYASLRVPGIDLRIVVVGSEGVRSKTLARGLDYVEAPNPVFLDCPNPTLLDATRLQAGLFRKYDAGISACRKHDPDAVLLVGSDDYVAPDWIAYGLAKARDGFGMVGLTDFFLIDIASLRTLHWPGYTGHRAGQTIGGGRIFSRAALDAVDWRPHGDGLGPDVGDEAVAVRIRAAGFPVFAARMSDSGSYWTAKSGFELNPIGAFRETRDVTRDEFPRFAAQTGWDLPALRTSNGRDCLMILQPRRIPEAIASLAQLLIDKVWFRAFTEPDVAPHVNQFVRETHYENYLIVADDVVVTPAALEWVRDLLRETPVATGYCRIAAGSPFVNLTRRPLTVTGPMPTFRSYDFFTRDDVRKHDSPFLSWFAGWALTGMRRQLWLDYPFEVHPVSRCQSDAQTALRLARDGIPFQVAPDAEIEHLKRDPNWSLTDHWLVGVEPPAVVWEKAL